MKILHVLDHSLPLHSGYTFRSRAIFEQQRQLGCDTYHITGPKHAFNIEQTGLEETADGLLFYRTTPSDSILFKRAPFDQLGVIHALQQRLEQVIGQIAPDIVHAHSPALNGIAALRAVRRNRMPVVYEVRGFWEDAAVSHGTSREGGLRYRASRALESRVLRRADAVTCICEGLRADIVDRGVDRDVVTVIPNAVDPERFTPIEQRDAALAAELGLGEATVLGFIGSFYHYEGLGLLLQALPTIIRQRPDVRVLLVGGGPVDEALRRDCERLGIADRVLFTGRVPHQEVERFYSVIDLLVYPRLSMRITELVTPLKPLEAMAQGRLFIASDVGGHRELVDDGVTGMLFRAGDADDLARRALELLGDKSCWPALRRAGLDFVRSERNWRASVARYLPVYERLMESS